MSSVEVLARLAAEVAEDQWGLVTRAQALATGVPRATFGRLVAAGALVRVAHGVYRITGGLDPGHLELRAAWLQLDPTVPAWQRVRSDKVAVVSHRSAAELYGLGDLIADTHEFSVPERTQTRRPDVRLYLRQVLPGDRVGNEILRTYAGDGAQQAMTDLRTFIRHCPTVVASASPGIGDSFHFAVTPGPRLGDDSIHVSESMTSGSDTVEGDSLLVRIGTTLVAVKEQGNEPGGDEYLTQLAEAALRRYQATGS